MAPAFDDRQSHQDASTDKEFLVDITTEPTSPSEAQIQLKPRRKRLSDIQEETEEPQLESKPQRRCLSDVAQPDVEEPAPERPSISLRPRLSSTPAQTAVLEMPADTGTVALCDIEPARAPLDEVSPIQPSPDSAHIGPQTAELQGRQNLILTGAGGLLAAVVGAMLWAVVTLTTSFYIAWMAIPVGLLVGSVVRALGRGHHKSFGWLGASFALLGCLLGNHLTNCMFIARETGLTTTSVLTQISPAGVARLMIDTFHPLDVLFYGVAVYLGYRFSFRRISATKCSTATNND